MHSGSRYIYKVIYWGSNKIISLAFGAASTSDQYRQNDYAKKTHNAITMKARLLHGSKPATFHTTLVVHGS
jgi:hypothetical protein